MFVDLFNDLLVEHNLNRRQFADRCGIPYTTVIGWTTLNRLPDFTALIKIADFFDCSVDYLTGRQGNYENVPASAEITHGEIELLKSYRKLDSESKEIVLKLTRKLNKK